MNTPNEDPPAVHLKIACRNLRHKMMYVDQRQQTFGMVDDSSDTRMFWCTKTQDALGPDGDGVDAKSCSPSRNCYCRS